ncbi:hypothetical protein XELAEV_18000154mg [Xenopus laevis]|uniref:Uncharacterized protein n=1 Tax=Xenopus laevis TaxID=8355 RepID=A0A974BQZ8_XENLA|nr:hypothetical protein XELAEV_18000154mg [Xenopus laevis]
METCVKKIFWTPIDFNGRLRHFAGGEFLAKRNGSNSPIPASLPLECRERGLAGYSLSFYNFLREQISEDTGLSLKLFYWDKTFDVSWLAEQLKNSLLMPITGVSFIPLSVTSEDEWKAAADRNSVIVMCHSPRSGKPRDYLNPYMEYFMKTWGPSKITMIIIDLDNDPLTGVEWRNWWYKSPFAQCNLQLFTTEEMDEKRRPEHKSKGNCTNEMPL